MPIAGCERAPARVAGQHVAQVWIERFVKLAPVIPQAVENQISHLVVVGAVEFVKLKLAHSATLLSDHGPTFSRLCR